jgi:hypothetical protein
LIAPSFNGTWGPGVRASDEPEKVASIVTGIEPVNDVASRRQAM